VISNPNDEVRLTVLGCAGSSYDQILRQPCSSYLIETDDAALLLDCGYGSFASYHELAPETHLDAIFVSHAHADHVGDLEAFMSSTGIWRDRPRLLASEETMAVIVSASLEFVGDILVVVSDGSRMDFANFSMEFSQTTHQVANLATCVSIGARRVVYSADTGPSWIVPENFVGADLALVECTLEIRTGGDSEFHLDAAEAAAMARQLSARTTVITHVPPRASTKARLEMARSHAPNLEFIAAVTGLQLTLS
jgi:ribonuclease BN (tRNA processing enzyme)